MFTYVCVHYRDLRKALFGRYKRKERVEDDRRDDRGRGGPRPGGRDDFRDRRRDRSPDRRGRSAFASHVYSRSWITTCCANSRDLKLALMHK